MVFQRNSQNMANIYIEGSINILADQIEARITTLDQTGQPIMPIQVTNWATIACPINGTFSGALFNQTAGWYNLEIRASNVGLPIDTTTAIKVGIGEVFVIAGQSNATGGIPQRDPTIYAPTDDRVNTINLFDSTSAILPEMNFSHLESSSFIAPIGVTAWCWGVFGQQISTNWNVPIMLFNTALGNTSVFDWSASARDTVDICRCKPYLNLKKILTNYALKTGIRAVFWHQGENDNGNFGNILPPTIYFSNLKTVINKSRSDYQNNISWVIAKVSRVKNSVNTNVTDGQQLAVDSLNYNTYLGPLSDNIQPSEGERDTGGVHLWGQGLTDIGNSWFDSVNNANFLSNSTPQLGKFTITGCSSVKSGNWDDPTTWSGGRIPVPTDEVIICKGNIIYLNLIGHAKNISLNGELQMGTLGELKFGE